MKQFKIFYFIELIEQGGHRLVIAENQEKAVEIFKSLIYKEGNADVKITEIREI